MLVTCHHAGHAGYMSSCWLHVIMLVTCHHAGYMVSSCWLHGVIMLVTCHHAGHAGYMSSCWLHHAGYMSSCWLHVIMLVTWCACMCTCMQMTAFNCCAYVYLDASCICCDLHHQMSPRMVHDHIFVFSMCLSPFLLFCDSALPAVKRHFSLCSQKNNFFLIRHVLPSRAWSVCHLSWRESCWYVVAVLSTLRRNVLNPRIFFAMVIQSAAILSSWQ